MNPEHCVWVCNALWFAFSCFLKIQMLCIILKDYRSQKIKESLICFYNIKTTATKAGSLAAFIKMLRFSIPSNKGLNDKAHTDPLYTTVEGKKNLRKHWNFSLKSLFMLLSDMKGKNMVQVQTKKVKEIIKSTCLHMSVIRNGVFIC